MNHIELFAGCGGLSLGLEQRGFDLLMANELSPMAAETFAYNNLNLNLRKGPLLATDRAYWLESEYERSQILERLRENPLRAQEIKKPICDLDGIQDYNKKLRRSLLVGSIVKLNCLIDQDGSLAASIASGFGNGGIDLVSGGPPCQSFSMAGLRQHTNVRNQLPLEFAKFVGFAKPKIVLLENVTGILRAFNVDGEKHYAWFEVSKAFAVQGYVPICLHVNAKYVGTAQNRPRFILLALRRDVFKSIEKNSLGVLATAMAESDRFYTKVDNQEVPRTGDLTVHDVEDYRVGGYRGIFDSDVFRSLVSNGEEDLVSVEEAIDDLRTKRSCPSDYVVRINNRAYGERYFEGRANHEFRNHSKPVQARFRLYQIAAKLEKSSSKEISKYLRTKNRDDISDATLKKLMRYKFLVTNGTKRKFGTATQMARYLKTLHTKKQTQKALIAKLPAPAAMSIPDDACHYHDSIQRTLSVREMARIQSFPDWFVFRSKVTTGGQMRRYEVPQYTQVGNAVPPLLGLALGKVCKNLLDLAS